MSDEKIVIGSQKNTIDAALELTQLWHKHKFPESVEELSETYKTFYKVVLEAKKEK